MKIQPQCPSALIIKGEHFPCRQLEDMVDAFGRPALSHEGWAHSNPDVEAIWGEQS